VTQEGATVGDSNRRLVGALVALREFELNMAETLDMFETPSSRVRGRLMVLCDFFRSRVSRIDTRLAARGGCPLHPVTEPYEPTVEAICAMCEAAVIKYEETACVARRLTNPSDAWVCSLNAAELRDAAAEISTFKHAVGPEEIT
jgi:hypothetical protein